MTACAWRIARDMLADPLPGRWQHVQGVAARALEAAPIVDRDGGLLVSAAVLHDVGYAPTLVDTGFHPLDGARYLRSVGAPERLSNLVAHHSCAVVEAELRGLAGDLAEFEDEKTALRDALWWADMTTTPDGQRTMIVDRLREIEQRYGSNDVVTRFIRLARPALSAAVERTERLLNRHHE